MSANYRHIALTDAVPGMVLSDDVQDSYGQMLLPHSTVLTAAMLEALPQHGIGMIAVINEPLSEDEEQAARALRERRLQRLFRNSNDEGPAALLRRYITDFQLGGDQP
jgi:hypothetical protein